MTHLYEELVCVGGVDPRYFWRMSLPECVVYLEGMRRRERMRLEHTRLQMWASLRPYSPNLQPEDVLKTGTDDGEEGERETEAERAEAMSGVRARARMFERMSAAD